MAARYLRYHYPFINLHKYMIYDMLRIQKIKLKSHHRTNEKRFFL